LPAIDPPSLSIREFQHDLAAFVGALHLVCRLCLIERHTEPTRVFNAPRSSRSVIFANRSVVTSTSMKTARTPYCLALAHLSERPTTLRAQAARAAAAASS
jgi:hypothetical protein